MIYIDNIEVILADGVPLLLISQISSIKKFYYEKNNYDMKFFFYRKISRKTNNKQTNKKTNNKQPIT